MKALILTVLALMAIPLCGRAQADAPLPTLGIMKSDAAPLRQTETGKIVSTIDGTMLHLKTGETIELAGIWIPPGAGFESSTYEVKARQFIETLMNGEANREIILFQTNISGQGRVNRLGHELAHVVRTAGNVWLQGALIANGLAQAWPTPSNPELAAKMYALENQAREAGLGLWAADSPYRLLQADEDIRSLDRFAIVEGTVKQAANNNNIVYLNFGDEWKNDFTIGIAAPVRQMLARNNIDVLKLSGQRVRVRGWVRYYNGPYIDLELPIQLQTLDQPQQDTIKSGSPQLSIINRRNAPAPVTHSAGEVQKNVP